NPEKHSVRATLITTRRESWAPSISTCWRRISPRRSRRLLRRRRSNLHGSARPPLLPLEILSIHLLRYRPRGSSPCSTMRRKRSLIECLDPRRLLTATPQLVRDLLPPDAGYNPYQVSQIRGYNGQVFFVAEDGSSGFELWKSDGTQSNATLVKDIAEGGASSYPYNLVVSNGTLFFTADDGIHGVALWK